MTNHLDIANHTKQIVTENDKLQQTHLNNIAQVDCVEVLVNKSKIIVPEGILC
jgi:hypothetical protein